MQLQLNAVILYTMEPELEEISLTAWAHLVRAQQLLLERIEADLKKAELPPLRWYDVLLELHRAGSGGLRQFEVGAAVLLSKYNDPDCSFDWKAKSYSYVMGCGRSRRAGTDYRCWGGTVETHVIRVW